MKAEPHNGGSQFVVVASPGMKSLAERVVAAIKRKYNVFLPLYDVVFEQFANSELIAHIPETVRRQHVFFFHAMQHPDPNTSILMLLLANDALMRASAAGITLVTPYLPYLRQDRKHKPRVPISARMLADIIESNACVERIITTDMHADQEQGFFSIPVDNLTSMSLFTEHFARLYVNALESVVIVSPDFGGAVRARRFAHKIGDLPVAIFEKRRPQANQSEVVSLIGASVEGKVVVMYDDMIDTGGTIRGVVAALKSRGATKVFVCATHGIFSGGAEKQFGTAGFPILCTDSIPRDKEYQARHASWLTVVSMDELLADAVYEASLVGGSVSKLST